MRIGITGGTGFIGRYIIRRLGARHELICWKRETSDVRDVAGAQWIDGSLTDTSSMARLCSGCQAIVHAALWKPGASFRGGEGGVARFAEVNVIGTLNLIQSAIDSGVQRFIYLSTCAVHEMILDDRPLDEAHPLWATSHYGAHKAAVEKFVHSFGLGQGYDICALRPTGVYGVAQPVSQSKWFELIRQVVSGSDVSVAGGGKEVHASDVAKAVEILISADGIAGQAYNCYDQYVSQYEVAHLAKQRANSPGLISGQATIPKHQIETAKIQALGMSFGGRQLLQETVHEIVDACRSD